MQKDRVPSKVKCSPVACFRERKKQGNCWSENCLMDLTAIPVSEEELRRLKRSEIQTAPVMDSMIRVMEQKDFDQIIGDVITQGEGVISQKKGKVYPLTAIHDGELNKGHHITFKLDEPYRCLLDLVQLPYIAGSLNGIFYSSIGRHAAMMRWRYAGVTPMLRRLLSALMMLSQHLSRL